MKRHEGARAIFFQVLLVIGVLSLIAILVALGSGTAALLLLLGALPLLIPCPSNRRTRIAAACSALTRPSRSRAPPAA
jgi:hypothetical protein